MGSVIYARQSRLQNTFMMRRILESYGLARTRPILAKKDCPLCGLVIKALSVHTQGHWKEYEYPIETCFLGRQRGRTSAPALEVWFVSTSKTLPAGISGHSVSVGQILLLNLTGMDQIAGGGYKVSGRPVSGQINHALLQIWIQDCTLNHGEKCHPPSAYVDEKLYLLLVDVQKMCLVRRDWGSRYLALSYVWGKSNAFITVKENFEELQRDGAILQHLDNITQVIKDAMEFVRDIGEKYLWADQLCIIQDDPGFMAEYLPRMDKIFGHALITVVAISGQNANAFLPGIRPGSRAETQTKVKLGDLTLVAKLPCLFITKKASLWDNRAWTFQEGVLSRKKVYFSKFQMFWRCSVSYHAEDFSPASEEENSLLRGESILKEDIGTNSKDQFHVYQSLVKRYSNREMTYAVDSLHAFAGIISVLEEAFAWTFISALPERFFDLALLWVPMGSVELRPRNFSKPGMQHLACKSPTWCWTAWKGNVYWDPWRLDAYVGNSVNIRAEIRSLMINDDKGLRKIMRHVDAGTGPLTDSEKQVMARYCNYDAMLQNALVFEAKTAGFDCIKLKQPNLESQVQENAGKGIVELSDYIKRMARRSLWIHDDKGHHCGTIFGMNMSWASSRDVCQCEIAELSRSDQDEVQQANVDAYLDHLPPEYPSAMEYYGEIFNTTYYHYRRWWAVNILLLEWKEHVAERVAVGQIHADAWQKVSHKVKQIVLT